MKKRSSQSLNESETSSRTEDRSEHAEPVASASDGMQATRVRYGVLCGLCIMATVAYIQRNSIVAAELTIRGELGLSKAQMGAVMSAFFVTYAVFQIPAGSVVHVWGVRRALTLITIAFSLMTGFFACSGGLISLIAVRLGMGALQAGIFPASTTTIAGWFPPTQRAMPNGNLGSCMQIGGAIGAMLTGSLVGSIGWRWMYVLYALPGIVWAFWFGKWFRNDPVEHPAINAAELSTIRRGLRVAAAKKAPPTPWRTLITNRSMTGICGQQFCRCAAANFFGSWFATYLQEARGVSLVQAALLTSLPLWSTVLGSFVGGLVSDNVFQRTGSLKAARQGIGVLSMVACALFATIAYFISNPLIAVILISAGSFSAAFAGPCAYSITIDVGGRHVPAVFSTMNMCGNLGAAVFPLLVPLFLEATGSWSLVLFLFVGLYIVAAAFWLLAEPTRPIFDDEPLEPDVA